MIYYAIIDCIKLMEGSYFLMLETRLLYYFLAVAREQNITKAAQVLHIAQPSLSTQMADLEKYLGKKLIIRGKKKTVLTEDGALLRTKAEEIVSLLEKCESSFKQDTFISGDICIGCAETKNIIYITEILNKIHQSYPNVRYRYISGMADDIIEKLDSGVADTALMIAPVQLERFNYMKLPLEERFGLLMRKDSALAKKDCITIDDLIGIPLIMSDQNVGSNEMVAWYKDKHDALNIVAYYNLIYNAVSMVEQGMGYAYCLENLVNLEGMNLTFRPFYPEMKSSLFIVTKKYHNLSSSVKLFLQMCENL